METNEKKKISVGKLLLIIGVSLISVLMVLTITAASIWHNEIGSIMSIKEIRERNDEHLDGSVYRIDIKGGFYLEDLIAEGGVKSDAELISFITKKLTKGIIPMEIEAPEIGCSSFTATTEAGNRLFARNYDFSKTNTAIVFTDGGKNRYKTISSVDLQFLGIDADKGISSLSDKLISLAAPFVPLDGINEKGLAVGIYMTYQGGEETIPTSQNDPTKPDITSTTMLRLMLDYAGTVEEAVEIASKYNLHDSANTSYHYMVADATGKSAILEWVGEADRLDNDGSKRELKVTYNDNDSHIGEREGKADFQWITNFIIEPGYYEENDPNKAGEDRYDAIYNELNKVNGIVKDTMAAMDILKLVGRRSWNNDDNNGITVHSAIYDLTEKKMIWVPNENFSDKTAYFEFGF